MNENLFPVSGSKISTLLIDHDSLKFSSNRYHTSNEFKEAWDKKLSLATKTKINFEKIRVIKKEEDETNVVIRYKTKIGIVTICEFSFFNKNDYEIFFDFFEKQRYYQRRFETLTPLAAASNYFLGLAITLAFTVFCHYEAVAIANGTASVPTSGKGRAFYNIIELLGEIGVLLIGGGITAFILYKIWQRFNNPPNITKLIPPNS